MRTNRLRRGFTLVELLVVIGVIAVLIALLMPALSAAREHANRVKCLATLRSMAQAAQMHAVEHRGYMPVAGAQYPREAGVRPTSDGLRDHERRKYMYHYDRGNDLWRPLPLPAALGHYMGLGATDYGNNQDAALASLLRSDEMYRRVSCPGQPREQIVPSATVTDGYSGQGPEVYMSYVFNGSALGLQICS